jgi:hypothetical protein
MKGRLNLFQVGMLRWRDLAPYNAVHAVRVERPLTAARLRQAIDGELVAFGLTGFELDRRRARFTYRDGPAAALLDVIAATPDPDEALRAEVERQINLSFPATGRFDPLRFFAVDRGESFELGIAYDHFIAAGDSIIVLLAAIAERYRDSGASLHPAPERRLYPPTYRTLFLRNALAFLRGLSGVPAMVSALRRAFRPPFATGESTRNGFVHLRVGPERHAAMRRAAKAWGVTQNDLLLALLLLMLSPAAAGRRDAARRRELAVASIVNIRGDCGIGARAVFGQFLSSFLVTHPVPPGIALDALVRDVHAETARVKARKLYLQTLMAMALGGVIVRAVAPPERARFYRKSYPVWGGMTSLNVEGLWTEAGGHGSPVAYLRAASTGPQAPLVATMTGSAGGLDVGLSFRTVAFSRAEVDRMAAALVDSIARLP